MGDRAIDHDKEMGTCPHCGSEDYSRDLDDVGDDVTFYKCDCLSCNKRFTETFVLKAQGWEEEEINSDKEAD